jgi:hypothetical protein
MVSPNCFLLAPTFRHLPDVFDTDYVEMIIHKDDGTQEKKRVFASYYYVSMYFELIRTCHYDMDQTNQAWNQWWQYGKLHSLNVDLKRFLNL